VKRIIFTVTNDLNFDQRMHRICTSLSNAGYSITLVGRKLKTSVPLIQTNYRQHRLSCFFNTGFLFYAEYNLRLFFYLWNQKTDALCAIDLDTIAPVLAISKFKKIKRIYDAHELFCEMKEVVSRPRIYRFWKWLERSTVPHFIHGYTVNAPIRNIFKKDYGVEYEVIRNVPYLQESKASVVKENFIIYQGAVNEGRSFETLIPAIAFIDCPLHIYGDGNFLEQAKALTKEYKLEQKVVFKGKAFPADLRNITPAALLGITLFENNGLSNFLSLANRFFDYIQAGIPQLCVGYPAYKEINDKYSIAVLINDLQPKSIADAINNMLADKDLLNQLRTNCNIAREELNWQNEEKILIAFYKNLFHK